MALAQERSQAAQKVRPARPQAEQEPEAYPLGYVEDSCELRTPLADFFSSLRNISVLRCGMMTRWFVLLLMFIGLWCLFEEAHAQPMDDSYATTEQSCSFGMAKGETSQSCHVPFPTGCLVAHLSLKEAAERLQRPVNTLYKALNRIRRTLMECVARYSGEESQELK